MTTSSLIRFALIHAKRMSRMQKVTFVPVLHNGSCIVCYSRITKIIKLTHSQTLCSPVALARIGRMKSVCPNGLSPDVPFSLPWGTNGSTFAVFRSSGNDALR